MSETADNYPHTLAMSGRWRIVRCKDDLQYIVQRREATGSGKWPWRAVAYVCDLAALPGVLQRRSLGIPAQDVARLTFMPGLRAHAVTGGETSHFALPGEVRR